MQTMKVDFVSSLPPFPKRLLTNLRSLLEDFLPEEQIPVESKNKTRGLMYLDRLVLMQNLKEKHDYNPLGLDNNLKQFASICGSKDKIEEPILIRQSLLCLDIIGTKEAYEALFDCLTDKRINSALRIETINCLSINGTSKALEVLKRVKEHYEKCHTAENIDPDFFYLYKSAKEAITAMESKFREF